MTAEQLNAEYTQVCAQLGDTAFKLMELREARASLDAQIEALDKQIGEFRKTRVTLVEQKTALDAAAAPAPVEAVSDVLAPQG